MSVWRLTPIALALLCAAVQAQESSAGSSESAISLSGFGTVGFVGTDTGEAQYVISGQPNGATSAWNGGVDTKLGVQANAKLNKMFSGTVQVLSKQNGNGSFRPELEWAFAKAQFSPSLAVRVGRMGGPFFAVSDFRDVGYANTWLRPPQDVYGQVPISRFDGADVNYQTSLGSTTLNAQLYGGKSSAVFEGLDVKMDGLIGFSASAELESGFTFRLGHVEGKLTVDSPDMAFLVGKLRSVPMAAVSSVGDQLIADKKKASFTGFGVTMDRDNMLAMFEYTMRRTDSFVPDTDGWYLTLGYRFGKFTPYATVSELKQKDSNVNNTIPTGVAASLTYLKGVVDATLQSQSNAQKTLAVGLRWDAYRNIAVKTQYERIKADGPGLFTSPSTSFTTGQNNVNVYSVAVDFVF
ncbi:hypothetical protein [Roseateles koreensis]|nr:hypothetical protein [Roseateles koreensis]